MGLLLLFPRIFSWSVAITQSPATPRTAKFFPLASSLYQRAPTSPSVPGRSATASVTGNGSRASGTSWVNKVVPCIPMNSHKVGRSSRPRPLIG